jgi:hypothetical protein
MDNFVSRFQWKRRDDVTNETKNAYFMVWLLDYIHSNLSEELLISNVL